MRDPYEFIGVNDYLKRYPKKKQRAIAKLIHLANQGIPAIYTRLPREDLMLMFNLLLFRALHGFYEPVKVDNMKDYAVYAFRAFGNLQTLARKLKTGSKLKKPVAKATIASVSGFIPYDLLRDWEPMQDSFTDNQHVVDFIKELRATEQAEEQTEDSEQRSGGGGNDESDS